MNIMVETESCNEGANRVFEKFNDALDYAEMAVINSYYSSAIASISVPHKLLGVSRYVFHLSYNNISFKDWIVINKDKKVKLTIYKDLLEVN